MAAAPAPGRVTLDTGMASGIRDIREQEGIKNHPMQAAPDPVAVTVAGFFLPEPGGRA